MPITFPLQIKNVPQYGRFPVTDAITNDVSPSLPSLIDTVTFYSTGAINVLRTSVSSWHGADFYYTVDNSLGAVTYAEAEPYIGTVSISNPIQIYRIPLIQPVTGAYEYYVALQITGVSRAMSDRLSVTFRSCLCRAADDAVIASYWSATRNLDANPDSAGFYYFVDYFRISSFHSDEYPNDDIAMCLRLVSGYGVRLNPSQQRIKINSSGNITWDRYTSPQGDNAIEYCLVSSRQLRQAGRGEIVLAEGDSPEVGPESEASQPGGNFDNTSDTIAIPADPSLGVSNVGFVRVYNTGSQSLQTLGVELFPPLAYTNPAAPTTASDVVDAIIQGVDTFCTFCANIPSFFDQIMANALINYVIDCHIVPVNPGAGVSEQIKVGYKELTATGGRIYNDYVNVPCGSINVGEYYKNFVDFAYTQAKLYLPFVGFVPARAEWFQSATLSVDYKFNIIDGSFACYVRSGGAHVNNGGGGTIVGQYSGNACIHLPITGTSYASMVSGLVGAGAGMMAGAASGNIAGVATSAVAAAQSHGDIAQSNSYNGSAAFLGCRYPFLLIERPVSSYARNYQHEIGLPANIYAKLGDVPGFVRMERVHVAGISGATETEQNEIARLLAQGVIV